MLVYAGGIVVLYLFVVMLVNLKRPPEAHSDPRRLGRLGVVMALAVLAELVRDLRAYGWAKPAAAGGGAEPEQRRADGLGALHRTT